MTKDGQLEGKPDVDLIDPVVRTEIERRLAVIESGHDVRILFAIESGSRAWGFPSPDSDYDVRFVYVHKRDWYLTLWPGRDVIETAIEGLYDINGWDLRKALTLLIKPNPVLHEWLASPICYRADQRPLAAMRALAAATVNHRPALYHYLNLGEGQWRRFIEGRQEVNLKKYFYVLRPALALRWLARNDSVRVPMAVSELRAGAELPLDVETFLDDLIARKRSAKELGTGPRIPTLDAFITAEFEQARQSDAPMPPRNRELSAAANRLFLEILADAW